MGIFILLLGKTKKNLPLMESDRVIACLVQIKEDAKNNNRSIEAIH